MNHAIERLSVMIAEPGDSPWATRVADALSPLPVDLLWPRTSDAAVGLAVRHEVDLGVVDDELPGDGGLNTLRRIRRLGLSLPCLLICRIASQRVLHDAIALEVVSVMEAEANSDMIVPMIVRVARRMYRPTWPEEGGAIN